MRCAVSVAWSALIVPGDPQGLGQWAKTALSRSPRLAHALVARIAEPHNLCLNHALNFFV